jgi:Endoribonuclease YbeY
VPVISAHFARAMMRTAIYKASSGASLASQLRARCAASAGGGGCQSLGWPLPAQQRRQQQRRLVHTIQQGSLRGLVTVVAAADSAEAASSSNGSGNGLPFALSRPRRLLRFKWGRSSRGYAASALQVEVDVLTEGRPSCVDAAQLEQLLEQLEGDAAAAVPLALRARAAAQPRYRLPAVASLSLVLCDDQHIRSLNQQYRGKDTATDVLSFEIPDEAPGLVLPIKLLGDLVISLDTAQRQANERGCGSHLTQHCWGPARSAPRSTDKNAHAHDCTHTRTSALPHTLYVQAQPAR